MEKEQGENTACNYKYRLIKDFTETVPILQK